jgi:hypothetical protein
MDNIDQSEMPYSVPSDEQMIWRYVDRKKFELLIKNKALFFARASMFRDAFEGSFPRGQPELERILSFLPYDVVRNATRIDIYGLEGFAKWLRHWVFANCWHMNECESLAMWKLYLKKRKGIVCIQSTFKRLCDSLPAHSPQSVFGKGKFHIGKINYISYADGTISTKNLLSPFFCKRKEYSHERELRAVFLDFPIREDGFPDRKVIPSDMGRYVECNLERLIEKITVFPAAPSQFIERIEEILSRYALQKPVIRSSLDERPTF